MRDYRDSSRPNAVALSPVEPTVAGLWSVAGPLDVERLRLACAEFLAAGCSEAIPVWDFSERSHADVLTALVAATWPADPPRPSPPVVIVKTSTGSHNLLVTTPIASAGVDAAVRRIAELYGERGSARALTSIGPSEGRRDAWRGADVAPVPATVRRKASQEQLHSFRISTAKAAALRSLEQAAGLSTVGCLLVTLALHLCRSTRTNALLVDGDAEDGSRRPYGVTFCTGLHADMSVADVVATVRDAGGARFLDGSAGHQIAIYSPAIPLSISLSGRPASAAFARDGLTWRSEPLDLRHRRHDMAWSMWPADGGFDICLRHGSSSMMGETPAPAGALVDGVFDIADMACSLEA